MDLLFNPSRVAVVGVSSSEENLGRVIVSNLIQFGFKGEILCFGRREDHLFGHRIRAGLEDIPRGIDVAVILVPARQVLETVRAFVCGGTRRFVIETGGFSELGDEGREIEERIKALAAQEGLLVVGPNCIGIADLYSGFVSPFVPVRPDRIKRGKVAVVAQSGGIALSYVYNLLEEGIGVSKVVSMGNKAVLNEVDYLNYLSRDPETEVILLYMESVNNGRRFYEALKGCSKGVVVYKANTTEASRQIAQFHTAALATNENILTAAIKQARKVRVWSLTEAVDAVKALLMPLMKGRRLAIVSRSGGEALLAADAAGTHGFILPPYPEDLISFVKKLFRAGVINPINPLDLGDLFDILKYTEIVEEIAKRDEFDGIVFLSPLFSEEWEHAEFVVRRISEISSTYKKPVSVSIGGDNYEKLRDIKRQGIHPLFSTPEAAVKALTYSIGHLNPHHGKWSDSDFNP